MGTLVPPSADPAGGLVGRRFGAPRLYRDKSLGGTTAFFVVAFAASLPGVPVVALLATAVIVLAVFLLQLASGKMYEYILAASGLTGFIAWLGIAVSHYRFRRAYLAQGKDLNALVYRAKWFPFGPLLALALCVLVIIGQDTELVLKGDFSWDRLVITYMGLPVFLGFYAYHKLRYKTHKVPLQQVDLRQDSH